MRASLSLARIDGALAPLGVPRDKMGKNQNLSNPDKESERINITEFSEAVKKSGLAPAIRIESLKTCRASRCQSRFFHSLALSTHLPLWQSGAVRKPDW